MFDNDLFVFAVFVVSYLAYFCIPFLHISCASHSHLAAGSLLLCLILCLYYYCGSLDWIWSALHWVMGKGYWQKLSLLFYLFLFSISSNLHYCTSLWRGCDIFFITLDSIPSYHATRCPERQRIKGVSICNPKDRHARSTDELVYTASTQLSTSLQPWSPSCNVFTDRFAPKPRQTSPASPKRMTCFRKQTGTTVHMSAQEKGNG